MLLPIGVGIANASSAAATYSAMPIRSGRSQRGSSQSSRAPERTTETSV